MTQANILRVERLTKAFPARNSFLSSARKTVQAVAGVSFSMRAGETMGLVGESGCGKSTLGRLILRLIEPSDGEIEFAGQDIRAISVRGMEKLRRNMQIIFQDPYSSLNPRMTIGQSIAEPLRAFRVGAPAERRARVGRLLEMVGLRAAQADLYPHEFSGGQRQRIGIARALALQPKFIVCDEPVSALDVSVQAQILNLLRDLQAELGLTLLFISHDLAVVRHMSERIAIMYLGKLVELAEANDLFRAPAHPYTQALLSAVPDVGGTGARQERILLEGSPPSPSDPPSGCRFRTRCRHAMARCATEEPVMQAISTGHYVACHLHDRGATNSTGEGSWL